MFGWFKSRSMQPSGAVRDNAQTIFHVDTQFLKNALGVFEHSKTFEESARSKDAARRAANVATLVDALDLCNLLVLGDRIVFDSEVGGGRQQKLIDQIDHVATTLGDSKVGDMFRSSFGAVAAANEASAWTIQLESARSATAFFPRLARCARNVLDLFHLPHEPPTDPQNNLLRFLESGKQPSSIEIEEIESKKDITGRRFYAAVLSDEMAFRALCDARQRVDLDEDVLAVLFMNFRLRLAEQRSLSREKVLVGSAPDDKALTDALVYLPSMGRRDFSREFSRFIRWSKDAKAKNTHAFDLGVREYVLEEWDGVGCQMQLSERRAIPITVAAVLGTMLDDQSRRAEALLTECLRWKRENHQQILAIRQATDEFERLEDDKRKDKAAAFVAEILKSPSTEAARNRAIAERLSIRDGWLGLGIRTVLSPVGTLSGLVAGSTDKVRQHMERVGSDEYIVATHLSEAARPLLAGVGSQVRQCLIDIFGGTVIDARNPHFDPDRFPAAA